ncbi:hypothetical protein QFC19_003355 [Naganishia cerealis]|uniref:Uncharacterized protein n=1 Tax=Naganishia cerealis TaxID=610337 RepID=A0ACC2W4A0_9TREE|nr:hypothetical protein QFC19_003355 [Naganishia cerealis]
MSSHERKFNGTTFKVNHCKCSISTLPYHPDLTSVSTAVEGKARSRSKSSSTSQVVAIKAGFCDSNVVGQQLIKKSAKRTWTCKLPIFADLAVSSIDINEYKLWVRGVIEHEQVRNDGRSAGRC